MEAYIDEIEKPNLSNGLKGIRQLLGLSGNDSVCDLFCKIRLINNKIINLILEEKNSRREGSVFSAKRQLENSNKFIKDKLSINIDYAVVCNMPMEQPFKTRKQFNTPFKAIYFHWKGRSNQINLEGTKIPLLSS